MTRLPATFLFEALLKDLNIKTVKEYQFHPTRKWRIDYAIPEKKIGFEIDGGIFNHGRHTRPIGFSKDCYKEIVAISLGWKMLRIPSIWLSPPSQNWLKKPKNKTAYMPISELSNIIKNICS